MNFRPHSVHIFLVLAALCAFISGLAILLIPNFGSIGTDGSLYTLLGKNLADGLGFTTFGETHTIFNPLLPILIAFSFFITKNMDIAAHIPGVLFLVLTVPAVYFLAATFSGKRAGLAAAFLTAMTGSLLWVGITYPNPQIIAGLFSLLFLLFLYRSILTDQVNRAAISMGCLVVSGVMLSFAYLARPEYIMVPPLVAVFLWSVYKHDLSMRRILVKIGIFLLAFSLLAAPYILYLSVAHGTLSVTGRSNETALFIVSESVGGYEAIERADGAATIVKPPELEHGVLGTIIRNLTPFLKHALEGLLNAEQNLVKTYGFIGMIVFAFGLRALLLGRKWKELGLSTLGIITVIPVAALQGGTINYLVQFLPTINVLLAIGVITILDEVGTNFSLAKSKRIFFVAAIVGYISLYLFFPVVRSYLFLPADYQDKEYTAIGNWMKANIPDIGNTKIVSRKPEPIVKSGAIWMMLPSATSSEQLIEFMRRTNSEYLIADSRSWSMARPELLHMIEKKDIPKELLLMYEVEYEGQRIVLWKFVGE